MNKEIKKCQENIIYFVEKYVTFNGNPIKLTELQKKLLIEYNTNTSAEHPEMDDDIVRHSNEN